MVFNTRDGVRRALTEIQFQFHCSIREILQITFVMSLVASQAQHDDQRCDKNSIDHQMSIGSFKDETSLLQEIQELRISFFFFVFRDVQLLHQLGKWFTSETHRRQIFSVQDLSRPQIGIFTSIFTWNVADAHESDANVLWRHCHFQEILVAK